MKLSIIVPAYNEQQNIEDLIKKIEGDVNIPFELIIVNDHSVDDTGEIVEKLSKQFNNLKLFENTLDKGFANAMRTGFSQATGDAVIPIMADLCDDLSNLEAMLKKISEGYDIVCGARYIRGGARLGGPRIKALLSYLGGKTLHYLIGIPTSDIANSFKMYRKTVLDSIETKSKSFEISMDITVRAYFSGFKITQIPTIWKERTKGKTSFIVTKLLPSYLSVYIWAFLKRFSR